MSYFSALHADLMEEQEQRPVPYEGLVECPDCKGTGKDHSDYCTELGHPKCERCEGDGCIEADR